MDILIPAPPFKYALRWSATVVDQVQSKYPRATEMVCQACNISPYDLAKFIAKPDTAWIYLRRAIQICARQIEKNPRMDHYTSVKRTIDDLLRRKPVYGAGGGLPALKNEIDWGSGNQEGG